jgi:isopentenyl-diphosphate Delta-isomerase
MYSPKQNTVSMPEPTELVSLLAEDGTAIGVADKLDVHGTDTPLHLAFSCHVFNAAGEVLITRRALTKATWPGVWTNSFCGHPAPGESMESAIARRAKVELGIGVTNLQVVLPDFRYRAVDASGIVENEVCPVFTATTSDEILASADEVMEWHWMDAATMREAVRDVPFAFSPWLVLQFSQWRGVSDSSV